MTKTTDTSPISLLACEEGFDPIEDRLRANIRGTIEAVFKEELTAFSLAVCGMAGRRGGERLSPRPTGPSDHRDIWHRDDQRTPRPG